MGDTVRVGVIGYGYWGPNLVRNFLTQESSCVTMVSDLETSNLANVTKSYPSVRVTSDARQLIESPAVDAVAIATPVSTHFSLARQALEAGKHVLVEKPITLRADDAKQLIELARQNRRVLLVDHTFVYTGAVRKMRELIRVGELGELYYFESSRINLGLLQQDINVRWDLATHDLSILLYLIDERPRSVQAVGYRHVGPTQDEMSSLNLHYDSGFHAHIHVSWLSPVKRRLTLLGGRKRKVVFDDVEPSEKIRVYDKGIVLSYDNEEVTPQKPLYRAGDVFIPKLDRSEALQVEAKHFLDCILSGTRPISGGVEGLEVVRILEAADRSVAAGGKFVDLEQEDWGEHRG